MIIIRELFRALLGCIPAVVTCLMPALLIYFDVAILDRDCPEVGVVEFTQSALVLGIIIILAIILRRRPDLRGGTWLAFGFFLDILIREQDAFLDHVFHGFWVCPALIVAVVSICLALRFRKTIVSSFVHIRTSRHFDLLALGLSLLLVFSRIFGNKIIWKAVIAQDDFRIVKHVAEEGMELLSYVVLMLWAISYCRECLLGAGREAER